MICRKCNCQNPDGQKFCQKCGTILNYSDDGFSPLSMSGNLIPSNVTPDVAPFDPQLKKPAEGKGFKIAVIVLLVMIVILLIYIAAKQSKSFNELFDSYDELERSVDSIISYIRSNN